MAEIEEVTGERTVEKETINKCGRLDDQDLYQVHRPKMGIYRQVTCV